MTALTKAAGCNGPGTTEENRCEHVPQYVTGGMTSADAAAAYGLVALLR